MASNVPSRQRPSSDEHETIHRAMEEQDRQSENSDVDHLALDEDNLGQRFHDQDLDHFLEDGAHSQATTESTAFLAQNNRHAARKVPSGQDWHHDESQQTQSDDNESLPERLLMERERMTSQSSPTKEHSPVFEQMDSLPPPVPGPAPHRTTLQWDTIRAQQRLQSERVPKAQRPNRNGQAWSAFVMADPKEKAMWRWANVQNLDKFLADVYNYYLGRGIWSIFLSRMLNLLYV